MKRCVLAVLMLVSGFGMSAFDGGEEREMEGPVVYFRTNVGPIPVYDKPGGEVVEYVEVVDGVDGSRWYELVVLKIRRGYAYVRYVELCDADELSEKYGWIRKDVLVVNLQFARHEPGMNIPIYSRPDASSEVKLVVHDRSMECEIVKFRKDWLFVRLLPSGETGWVSKDNYNAWPW